MTTLIFFDRGYEVMTAAWTAAACPGKKVRICYAWGADGISWASSATGISAVDLDIDMDEFRRKVADKGLVDLRAENVA